MADLGVTVRAEQPGDAEAIRQLTKEAFLNADHSDGTEVAIYEALRANEAMTISLVAVLDGKIVGHAAFSSVQIDGADIGWLAWGPVSVQPNIHRRGIGSALINDGLRKIQERGVKGCVVLGDPKYYQRFGFERDGNLRYEGAPEEYFMRISFEGATPSGAVAFHDAFLAS